MNNPEIGSPEVIRRDFDRIAALSEEAWSQNGHYHSFLLGRLPRRLGEALDLGCGTGAFTRLLAARSDRVTGVDLSPEMIRQARARSGRFSNVEFLVADLLRWPWPREKYDGIASIATFHHLPLEEMLRRCAAALAPGGTLLVLDLRRAVEPLDYFLGALAFPACLGLRFARTGRLRESRAAREAWAEHGRHERYPAFGEVRAACGAVIPGAEIRRHLLWRYSIVWRKPAA